MMWDKLGQLIFLGLLTLPWVLAFGFWGKTPGAPAQGNAITIHLKMD